ncbi:polymer-forming cytoskeletal protein [Chryseobacterium nematophagum]|uniref:Polymer-forming cytoskeletal protein n=1 Tax=Chryseobacterium nematophagum TaxID=2305228 RepID=A0A3M7TJZ1_9FLAO|nr:polymer-forming cytoskeletal protein [Chryseobacterium nematophagum]RNA63227.1 polymer-forming cytoskeletal protein [Chryseobacterium nematophagum]
MMFNNKTKSTSNGKINNEVITSIIGEDMIITGDITSNTSIRIDGTIVGNVNTEKLIVLGEKANVTGNLKSKSIIIFGKLEGNINADEMQLKMTGIVNGDISVKTIEIEMGGKYNGNLMMNDEQREINRGTNSKEDKKPLVSAIS